MALTNEEILDAIASKTVLEISELIKMMEEKFGVTATAAVKDRRRSGNAFLRNRPLIVSGEKLPRFFRRRYPAQTVQTSKRDSVLCKGFISRPRTKLSETD